MQSSVSPQPTRSIDRGLFYLFDILGVGVYMLVRLRLTHARTMMMALCISDIDDLGCAPASSILSCPWFSRPADTLAGSFRVT